VAVEAAQDGVGVTVRSADLESDEVELGGRDTAERSPVALSQARFLDTSGRHVAFGFTRGATEDVTVEDVDAAPEPRRANNPGQRLKRALPREDFGDPISVSPLGTFDVDRRCAGEPGERLGVV
jgi:hypothetical protein